MLLGLYDVVLFSSIHLGPIVYLIYLRRMTPSFALAADAFPLLAGPQICQFPAVEELEASHHYALVVALPPVIEMDGVLMVQFCH